MAGKPFYRTLPGLDAYSDGFCRLLIRRLSARTRVGAGASALVNTTAALLLATFWAIGGAVAGPMAGTMFRSSSWPHQGVSGWQIGGAAVGGAIGFVVSYRVVARGMALSALREALRPRIIDGWKCMACGYSLDGLMGQDHLIVCPECGRMVPIGLGAIDRVEQMIVRGELPPEGRFALGAGAENQGASGHE